MTATSTTEAYCAEFLRQSLLPPVEANPSDALSADALINSAVAELSTCGYLVNPAHLVGVSAEYLVALVRAARQVRGADRKWATLFPDFPHGSQNSDEIDLLVTQLIQYWNYYSDMTATEISQRQDLGELEKSNGCVLLEPTTAQLCHQKFVELVTDSHALAHTQVDLLEALAFHAGQQSIPALIADIHGAKFVENIGVAHTALVQVWEAQDAQGDPELDLPELLIGSARTPDMLLRSILALYLPHNSAEKIETTDNAMQAEIPVKAEQVARLKVTPKTRLKPVPRRVRKLIVPAMVQVRGRSRFANDAFLFRAATWRRVLSSTHGFDYAKDPEQKQLLDILFGNSPAADEYFTLNALVDAGLKGTKPVDEVVEVLAAESPARLVRNVVSFAARDVLSTYVAVSRSHPVPVATLVSAIDAVRMAASGAERIRTFAGGKAQTVDEGATLTDAEAKPIEQLLLTKLSQQLVKIPLPSGPIGLANGDFPVPRSVDSRSTTVVDRSRLFPGQRVKLPGVGSTLRFFVHWVGKDLDLGVVILDKGLRPLDVLSFDTVSGRVAGQWSTFSGDVTRTGPEGAAEFFDIDLVGLRKAYPNARYLVSTVNIFSGHSSFSAVDNFAGVMRRKEPGDGAPFEARTVTSAAELNATGRMCAIVACDVVAEDLLWLDADLAKHSDGGSAFSHSDAVRIAVRGLLDSPRVSVSELLTLWARAHDATPLVTAPADVDLALSLLAQP